MDRKEFLQRCAAIGVGVFFIKKLQFPEHLMAQENTSSNPGEKIPDIIAVRGGTQASRLDRALKEFGGLSTVIRKGQTVVIKPNIGWSQEPRVAANTNAVLIQRLVEHCLAAGASKVWVFDHSCDHGPTSYRLSQIESYARQAGAIVVPGDSPSYYQEVSIPGAVRLKKTRVHELILQADVFINVPVLKNHSGAGMTCAMKNLMGMVWERGEYHRLGLDQCIADGCLYRKPTLNIVDAEKVMLTGGPRGYANSRYSEQNMLILSRDIVAIDAVSARVLGQEPASFDYIKLGAERGLGKADINQLDIRRITI